MKVTILVIVTATNYIQILFNIHLSRLISFIVVDFNVIDQLLIIYSTFVRYWRKTRV